MAAKRWEYLVERVSEHAHDSDVSVRLQIVGAAGWELVAVQYVDKSYRLPETHWRYLFKRPAAPPAAESDR